MDTSLLKEFVTLEDEKAACKLRLKSIQTRLDQLDTILVNQFVEDGVQSTNIKGRTVYLHTDIFASPIDGDKAAVVEALKTCDLGQYVREDYNANSVAAYVREMVRTAQEQARLEHRVITDPATAVPPQLAATLKITAVTSVSSRRS